MSGRGRKIACAIRGCTRYCWESTWTKHHGERPGPCAAIICRTHWRMLPPAWCAVYKRLRRRERKFGVTLDQGARLWRRMRRHIEKEERES